MIHITDEMQRWLQLAKDDGTPCLVGTASKDGRPQISPKGSIAVFDAETLCFWERGFHSSYQAISDNSHVVVYYRNPNRKSEIPYRASGLRFHGEARVATTDAERARVYELAPLDEREKDPQRRGAAILIRVDRIEDIGGGLVMQRDEGTQT